MTFLSPQPRFKLNSKLSDYATALKWLLFSSALKDDDVRRLEQKLCQLIKCEYAVAMPQARVGIFLALKAIIEPGQEVILSPNTIADVINMVICAGAKPVFCDIDPSTGNIDPDLVEELITPKTGAVMVTHLYGLMTPMGRLKKITSKHNIFLIEDAAQAFGASQGDGRYAGTVGDIGIYSFGMAKNIMAFYGGMLVTSNPKVEKKVRKMISTYPAMENRKLRNKIISCFVKDVATLDVLFPCVLFRFFKYGYKNEKKNITRLIEAELDLSRKNILPETYKERMTPLQANIVFAKLSQVDSDYEHRLKCAKIYYEGLKDIPELLLPPLVEDKSHVYNYYPIGFKDRKKLRLFLLENNRDVALQHIKNTADLPAFKDFYRECPNSRSWAKQTIMMPNYAKYRIGEVKKNIQVIQDFFKK